MEGFSGENRPFGFGPLDDHQALRRRTGSDRRGGDRRSGADRRRRTRRAKAKKVGDDRRSGKDRRHGERRTGRDRRTFEALKESAWRGLLGE